MSKTLRDELAVAVIPIFIGSLPAFAKESSATGTGAEKLIAEALYALADAMIAEGKKPIKDAGEAK